MPFEGKFEFEPYRFEVGEHSLGIEEQVKDGFGKIWEFPYSGTQVNLFQKAKTSGLNLIATLFFCILPILEVVFIVQSFELITLDSFGDNLLSFWLPLTLLSIFSAGLARYCSQRIAVEHTYLRIFHPDSDESFKLELRRPCKEPTLERFLQVLSLKVRIQKAD